MVKAIYDSQTGEIKEARWCIRYMESTGVHN